MPLIELSVDTTITGGKFTNAATINPGLPYVGVVYQVAAEAIVPLSQPGGRGVGVTAGLEFFLDDWCRRCSINRSSNDRRPGYSNFLRASTAFMSDSTSF